MAARKKVGTKAARAGQPPAPGNAGSVAAPQVFEYLDYRAFLRDYYVDKKAKRGFSFRSFSKRAGLGSPNYLKLVMDGERNLSEQMVGRFAKALGLDHDDSTYFARLVQFNQATSSADRAQAYARLTGFRRYRKARPLDAAQADYHSTWYLPAVRELAARKDFRQDPEWIARTLWPSISPDEAARGLRTLLDLGLLVRNAEGRIVQGDALVSTGPEARSVHVASYHRMMLERAERSIDEVPAAERDISSLTLCVGVDGLSRLKNRIQRFRRELLELSTEDTNPKQVVQVNLQLFPLSRAEDPEGQESS